MATKVLQGVGWLLSRLLAGVVMFGWLLMVFVIGGLIVLLRWLILLGTQRTVPTITKPKTSESRAILGTDLLFPEKKNQKL